MTDRKRKILIAGGGLAMAAFLWLLFSPWGLASYFRLKRDLAEVSEQNRELAASNLELKEQIERLKNDPSYLEEVARKNHGLLRKDEIIYRKAPKKPASTSEE